MVGGSDCRGPPPWDPTRQPGGKEGSLNSNSGWTRIAIIAGTAAPWSPSVARRARMASWSARHALAIGATIQLAASQFGITKIDWQMGPDGFALPSLDMDRVEAPNPAASPAPAAHVEPHEGAAGDGGGGDGPAPERQGLPLFLLPGEHLYPHAHKRLHLFEERYKLLVERALRSDGLFGFLSTDRVGTVARIETWKLLDDGRAHVLIRGVRRFKLKRQWAVACDGCDTGPLHHADVAYFSDEENEGGAEASRLARESLTKYHQLTTSGVHDALCEQHGSAPTLAGNSTFAISMWLSAACSSHPQCGVAEKLLRGRSTTQRLERILAFQSALLGGAAEILAATAAPPLGASARHIVQSLAAVRLRRVPLPPRDATVASFAERLHGKMLLLNSSLARAGRGAKWLFLVDEPRATGGRVIRGLDVLTPLPGRRVRDVTRPEFVADFAPILDELYVSHGGEDEAGGCGFHAMHSQTGLPHTRALLSDRLQLTDLQLDYAPNGGGPALARLKGALAKLTTRRAQRRAIKMLVGCRAWREERLRDQIDLGMWAVVDVVSGEAELATAALRTYGEERETTAVWEALWRAVD